MFYNKRFISLHTIFYIFLLHANCINSIIINYMFEKINILLQSLLDLKNLFKY